MFLNQRLGAITEPLTGRRLEGPEIGAAADSRAADYLKRGMVPGDRVFVHYGNSIEFFADVLALWRLGACVVPIDPRLTTFEVEALGRAAAPRCSFWGGDGGDAQWFVDAKPGNPEDALILFTSGTTGQPKGVVHTHRSLHSRWGALLHNLNVDRFRRTLCLLPTHFGHGLICNSLLPWLLGQELFILPPFRPDVIADLGGIVDAHGITCMSSVPAVWQVALRTSKPPQLRTLEYVLCGSAPLSASLWESVRGWAGQADVLNAYGVTELGSWVAGTTRGAAHVDGLIGEGWGASIRIGEWDHECPTGKPGGVWIKANSLMRGYLGREDLTTEAVRGGWFRTGDVGFVDDRGLLHLCGRTSDEINRGGTKVYPGDIDAVAERFDAVADVCAFGFDDPVLGQDVGMAVVLKARDDETVRGLQEWLRLHLARHQMPVRWYFVDAIPRTDRGKVSRAKVAEECACLSPIDLPRSSPR